MSSLGVDDWALHLAEGDVYASEMRCLVVHHAGRARAWVPLGSMVGRCTDEWVAGRAGGARARPAKCVALLCMAERCTCEWTNG
jgi:hypothetical protein